MTAKLTTLLVAAVLGATAASAASASVSSSQPDYGRGWGQPNQVRSASGAQLIRMNPGCIRCGKNR